MKFRWYCNIADGKLNVLDEFRVQKDELMRKFQQQEEARKEQEVRHQETLHNIEKDFILKKIQYVETAVIQHEKLHINLANV